MVGAPAAPRARAPDNSHKGPRKGPRKGPYPMPLAPSAIPSPAPAPDRRMYLFLVVLAVAAAAGFQGWRTLLNNFAVEHAGLDGAGMGLVQSLRELPGFLSLLALYVLLIVSEHRLAALSVLVMGVGVALTGLFPSLVGVVGTTMLMSFGFHYYETMNQSLTLQYFGPREAPIVMSRLRSAGAFTNIAVGGLVWVLALWLDYTAMFAVLGGVAMLAGLWALTRDPSRPDVPPQLKKLVFRRRYWLYYVLTFLAGARRQIFVAFAVFLLVEHYHFSVQHITVLFVLNNVINVFVNPIIGRAVNRFGERRVLSLEYGGLVLVFLAYAFVPNPWVASGLYVVDNVLFNFAMAIRTYYQKIADPGDIASGMAVGFTVNHIAAVAIPVLGGLAWLASWRAVFVAGAGLSLASLVMAQYIRLPAPGREG